MGDMALASLSSAAAQTGLQYAMMMEKRMLSDMEQQAMGELEMLPPPAAPGVGEYIDVYA